MADPQNTAGPRLFMPASMVSPPVLKSLMGGFSLAEVVLAIGIFSSVVLVMGMLPVAFNGFRAATDVTLSSHIAQEVLGDAQQTDFDNLLSRAKEKNGDFFRLPDRFFDRDGGELTVGDGVVPADVKTRVVYVARLRATRTAVGNPEANTKVDPVLPTLPAKDGTQRFRTRSASFLTVQVVRNPTLSKLREGQGDDAYLWLEEDGLPVRQYGAVLARNRFGLSTVTQGK